MNILPHSSEYRLASLLLPSERNATCLKRLKLFYVCGAVRNAGDLMKLNHVPALYTKGDE